MKIKFGNVLRSPKRADKMVTIRVPEDVKKWMEQQKVSPTKVFKSTIKKLGGPWK